MIRVALEVSLVEVDKQHILDEIKRTAKANGGRPLGKERFYRETGISEPDWLGKHWARWSDALRESGLEPNRMQGALDENDVIEKFVTLMREVGKFPTLNEVRLKAHNTVGFPWHNTFARFGSKQQFANRILAYCAGRAGHEDVVAICAGIGRSTAATKQDDDHTNETFGFVYLIRSGRYHKIGRSNAAGRREYELAIQLPEKATTIHSIRTDDPVGIEAYWHKRFESRRKNGEWFELSTTDVKAFRRRKFM
jgi:hypothetical protein